jgi:hypothetical protein
MERVPRVTQHTAAPYYCTVLYFPCNCIRVVNELVCAFALEPSSQWNGRIVIHVIRQAINHHHHQHHHHPSAAAAAAAEEEEEEGSTETEEGEHTQRRRQQQRQQ